MFRLSPVLLPIALALAACTTAPPSGPTVVAAAGKDKSAAAFRQDDADCRQAAAQKIAAAAPAQPAAGAPAAAPVAGTPQQRYDWSYAQCICAKGDTIERRYGAFPLVFTSFPSSVGMQAGGHGGGSR